MMDLENLTQFDKRKFKELFGLRIQEIRTSLNWTSAELAAHLNIPETDIPLIEAGNKTLSQDAFDYLREALTIDEKDILNIAKITQVQMLMEVYRELNEQYPK